MDFFSRGLDAEYRSKGVIIQVSERMHYRFVCVGRGVIRGVPLLSKVQFWGLWVEWAYSVLNNSDTT